MTVARETVIFLFSCLLGGCIGAVYDVFRIIRFAFFHRRWVVFIEDCIFVFIAALFTFLFSVRHLNGFFRIFVVAGEILGFIIYYFTVGIWVLKCSKILIFAIRSIIKWFYHVFLLPMHRFFKYIYTKIYRIFKHISQKLLSCRFGKKFHLKQ